VIRRLKQHSILPGFGLAMGFTIFYLCLVVLIPLAALFLKSATEGWTPFWETISHPRVVASCRLTFESAAIAATINAVCGFIVAWSLVRYTFPLKRVIDALVDLPFALPTAVSGIALTTIYSANGWIGQWFEPWGLKLVYSQTGIIIAMTFIGLPFVVRTLQPALEDLEKESEEASACLGANRWQTFRFVILPTVLPAVLTGFAMAFARGLGEYGSIVFISGNMPMKTEIASLLIITKLEQHDLAGATAIAVILLVASFLILLAINLLQWRVSRHQRGAAL
jgi:sulfate/thiosulfate transport system permease protein